jgi:putative salt-induced outer membrane protein YdiY
MVRTMFDERRFRPARAFLLAIAAALAVARPSLAQAPAPPAWDLELGASFVGTSGNAETSSTGANLTLHRRWPNWQIESESTAIRDQENGSRTTERYLTSLRAQRPLSPLVGMTTQARVERDLIAGISFRSILDAGVNWALVHSERWTVDGISAAAWSHEEQFDGLRRDDPTGLVQLVSEIKVGATGDTTQRVSYYPNFGRRTAYRSEVDLSMQAAMNSRLALKLGYLLRTRTRRCLDFGRRTTRRQRRWSCGGKLSDRRANRSRSSCRYRLVFWRLVQCTTSVTFPIYLHLS